MLNILDLMERALTGPPMSENDFNMKVLMPEIIKTVRERGLKYDPENPVATDDQAADNLWQAALDVFERIGVYCTDSNRIIKFTRPEILSAVKGAPKTAHTGTGKEAAVFGMRRPDDRKIPWFHVGSGIVSTKEEYATNIVEGYASIPGVNSINMPGLNSIRGMLITAGSPLEFYATLRQLHAALEGLRRAGRPGLPIWNCHPTPAVAVTNIAASGPQFGNRPTDGWLCGNIAELKVSYDTLNKVAYLKTWGANAVAEAGPMLGGYAGGPEGFALVTTAYLLMGQLVQRGDFQLVFPFHFSHTCSSTRDCLWAVSSAIQAASRNIDVPTTWANYCAAGPNTKMYLYEAAAIILTWTTSGAPAVMSPHPAKAVKMDGITPLEAKWAVEVGTAAAKLNRQQANEIVPKILELYEKDIPTAPEGDAYYECFDARTGRPTGEYLRLYDEVKDELTALGIPFE